MLEKVKKTLALGSETRAEKMNITLLDIKWSWLWQVLGPRHAPKGGRPSKHSYTHG